MRRVRLSWPHNDDNTGLGSDCKHCSQPETLTHVFYTCEPAAGLWTSVFKLLAAYCKEPALVPSARAVMSGIIARDLWLKVGKPDRVRAASVWRTIRAIALVAIRDARNRLYHDDKDYTAAALFFSWRREVVGVIYRAELHPQGGGVGETVGRWLHNRVFARRSDDGDLIVRIQP